ncbi:MAG TPA: hypothetical protein QF468_01865 [Nitrospinota bacterium]|nr:hypothetical protein [Nitrospinota bacterium]
MKHYLSTIVLTLFLVLPFERPILAQETNVEKNNLKDKISHLTFIKKNITWLQNEIKRVQKDLKNEISDDLKRDIQNDLISLKQRYRKAKSNFLETAAGVSLEAARDIESKKRNLGKEAQELIAPLLDTFHRISARPRMIESLRSDIAAFKEKISVVEKALKSFDSIMKFGDSLEILDDLKKIKEDTEGRLQGLKLNLEASQRQLKQETVSDKSFLEAATAAAQDFFRIRGKNLILSIVSFFSIWWVLSALRTRIFKSDIFSDPLAWVKKPLKALYNLIAILLAIIGTVVCLYLLNDWVLLTFVILFLSAVAWTSRQWIPKFMQEGRIILNLGTVRERERIIWQGVPFLVRDLGFYSTLINEQLQGGHIKVAAAEFIGMHSRPVVEDEPWFPTNQGDWVLLSDDTYGKILIQTPEQIVVHAVQTLGGTHKYYPTVDFLAQKPSNLSKGFCLALEFGLDYGVRTRICKEIPDIFLKGIQSRLRHRVLGDDPDFKDLSVEFHSAGESSLKLWVKVDCPGRVAHLYLDLYREMQTTLVDICNEHSFTIPFNQLTIHMPEKNKDGG